MDLELLTYDDLSAEPFSESKPTSPKLHTAIVDGKCVSTQQNAGASYNWWCAMIGSHCKQSTNKPEN